MRAKIIIIALVSFLLVACGKSEENRKKEEARAQLAIQIENNQKLAAQTRLIATQIERDQKIAVSRALVALSSLRAATDDYFRLNRKCLPDDQSTEQVIDNYKDSLESISVHEIPNGCQLKATFKESSFISDLSMMSILLKMSRDSEGGFYWTCEFTGENKKYLPEGCR